MCTYFYIRNLNRPIVTIEKYLYIFINLRTNLTATKTITFAKE